MASLDGDLAGLPQEPARLAAILRALADLVDGGDREQSCSCAATTRTVPWREFMDLETLVQYGGIKKRTLERYLKDPDNPLPHYKPGGKIMVRRDEFDSWVTATRRVVPKP